MTVGVGFIAPDNKKGYVWIVGVKGLPKNIRAFEKSKKATKFFESLKPDLPKYIMQVKVR